MGAESEAPVPTITRPNVSSRPTADTLVARAREMIPTIYDENDACQKKQSVTWKRRASFAFSSPLVGAAMK